MFKIPYKNFENARQLVVFSMETDKMAGFLKRNFDYYAGIACRYSLMDQMANRAGVNLSIEPDLCLSVFFLSFRAFVAGMVAKRNPAFSLTASKIERNIKSGRNSRDALAEEFEMASVFSDTPEISRDADYLVLMLAWASSLDPNCVAAKSAQSRILTKLDKVDNITGISNVILSAALWFADYEGYRAAVLKRFSVIKTELKKIYKIETVAGMRSGYIDRNMDSLIEAGSAAVCSGINSSQTSADACFMKEFWRRRGQAAQKIAERYPEFSPVSALIEQHNRSVIPQTPCESLAGCLEKEFGVLMPLYGSADWFTDQEAQTLLLAYSCWGFKDRDIIETGRFVRKNLFKKIDSNKVMPESAKFMLVIAMWFSNYDSYRTRVLALIPRYLKQNK